MICVTLQGKTLEEIFAILERPDVEMAEIRLDSCELTGDQITELFERTDLPLIATARPAGIAALHSELTPEQCGNLAMERLSRAIEAGARYADLDVQAPVRDSKKVQQLCTRHGVELIRSFHDYSSAPDTEFLLQIADRCRRYGADVVKIAVTAQSPEEAQRVLGLYDRPLPDGTPLERGTMVAFAMGEPGRDSRLGCLAKGAPFTYCALSEEESAAPGQWTLESMRARVYGQNQPYLREGLRMPASKSFAQRAIVAAAFAEGTSVLRHYTPCGDSEAAIGVARSLGAKVERSGDTLTITGAGHSVSFPKKVNVGESGLLARLMIPLLSVKGEEFTVEGEKTLLRRPLAGASEIMASFGVMLSSSHDREVRVPVVSRGRLIPGQAQVSGRGGSQLISGLLMALPLCDAPSSLTVNEPRSIPYMYITLDVLRRFGIKVRAEMEGDAGMLEQQDWSGCDSITFSTGGGCTYRAATVDLESDWSSAAPFMVAGAVFGEVSLDGLDSSSVQADINMIDILVEAGAGVSSDESGRLYVRKAPLEAFDTDLSQSPDLFPSVAVLAAFCDGESHISGASRLAAKESNRAEAIVSFLSQMGVELTLDKDVITVRGENFSSRAVGGRLLRGGMISSFADHRIAMAELVAGLGASEPLVLDDYTCLDKSFPGFREVFNSATFIRADN